MAKRMLKARSSISISTRWPWRSTATTSKMFTTRKQTPPKLIGKKGELCTNFVSLQDDGTTSCGNWLYSGSYTQKDGKIINMMARRGKEDPTGLGLYSGWAWAWPVNRRIIYNRASVDLQWKSLGPQTCGHQVEPDQDQSGDQQARMSGKEMSPMDLRHPWQMKRAANCLSS